MVSVLKKKLFCRHQKACHPDVGWCGGMGSMLVEAVRIRLIHLKPTFYRFPAHARASAGMT